MALVELVMPKMGESITEATVLKWLKQPGEPVKQDESLLEIATDKVDSDVPSTAEGFLEKVFFNANDVVPIGAVIATIRTEKTGENNPDENTSPAVPTQKSPSQVDDDHEQKPVQNFSRFDSQPQQDTAINRFYSPLVMNIATSEGVSLKELEQIPGTGNEGRVTKKDILQFVENRKKTPPKNSAVTIRNTSKVSDDEEAPENQVPAVYNGNVEIVEMDRMRKLIADHMVRSVHTSPHVTSFSEADVTNLVLWRESVKKDFEKREGTKITFTPLFIEALIRCI
ncbi:MAG TPA: biotin/lipoyl-containing protein, partial [Chitinophagaceae bacterium]|nr:biotin/lipoyl-containing protein [Chitinophagaceae bacterium]